MGTAVSSPPRGLRTQERIQAVALALFAEKGVDRTTIGDIAGAAGIAEGTIYRHFPGKEELIWQLFSTNYLDLAAELDAQQAAQQGIAEKLGAMVALFCGLFDQDPDMFRFLLLVQHGQLERVTPEMLTPVKVLKGVIEGAMARGEIPRQDADVGTAMVLGMVLQVAVFKVYGRIESDLSGHASRLAGSCVAALSAPGAATEG